MMNKDAYGRINEFLRINGRRDKEFTVQEIAENTKLSFENVKSTIEEILKDERFFAGGPSVVKGEKAGHYRSRTKYLDEFRTV